jgi:hypothetical protein
VELVTPRWKVVLFLIAAFVPVVRDGAPARAATSRAVIVVQHGDAIAQAKCVKFNERSISALTLVKRSRFEFVAAKYSTGHAMCWLDGEGCKSSRQGTGPGRCFCDPVRFWGYWTQERGEPLPSLSGAGLDQRVVRDGSVDYWVWGIGQPPIQPTTVDAVCG